MFAFLSSSKLKENLTELHIIVRTTGCIVESVVYIKGKYVTDSGRKINCFNVKERDCVKMECYVEYY